MSAAAHRVNIRSAIGRARTISKPRSSSMKTQALLVTLVMALPLGACIQRDRCDSHGWCDDNSPSRVCFYDSDCAKGAICQGGSCVSLPPVPPPRGYGGAGGSGGTGVRPAVDAGADGSHDVGGGGHAGTGGGGTTGAGGQMVADGGAGNGGAGNGGAGNGGAGGAPPADAGAGGAAGQTGGGGSGPGCDAGGGGAGTCHTGPTPMCQFDHQCGLTGRCVDGECQQACASNADCGTGQACTNGFCGASTTSGGQCVFNADCGAGQTCINGTCHPDCATDANCPAHDRCVGGICQADTGPSPQCRASADCVGVHVTEDDCVNAVCRTPCASDTDCCVGSSGSICQMGYCVTAHEVAPQCRANADCGAGKICSDAACE